MKDKSFKDKTFLKHLLEASTIGINLVLSTFVGLAMGYGIDYAMDKWFGLHTKPWFMIIFLFIGIIAGFRELIRMAKKSGNG
ncbi:MAG: AtpZ/AtpI family protein [Nitrospirota bacterium]